MRDSSVKVLIVAVVLVLSSLSCRLPQWVPFGQPEEVEVVVVKEEAEVSRHYLVVALARPGLHTETSRRIARQFREALASKGQRVTLAEDFGLAQEARQERERDFEDLFHAPKAVSRGQIARWTDPVGADRVVSCMLMEYDELWRADGKVKRIVLQAACDDVSDGTRLALIQIVAERAGRRYNFSEVERLAARKLLTGLWPHLRTAQSGLQEAPAEPAELPEATAGADRSGDSRLTE